MSDLGDKAIEKARENLLEPNVKKMFKTLREQLDSPGEKLYRENTLKMVEGLAVASFVAGYASGAEDVAEIRMASQWPSGL